MQRNYIIIEVNMWADELGSHREWIQPLKWTNRAPEWMRFASEMRYTFSCTSEELVERNIPTALTYKYWIVGEYSTISLSTSWINENRIIGNSLRINPGFRFCVWYYLSRKHVLVKTSNFHESKTYTIRLWNIPERISTCLATCFSSIWKLSLFTYNVIVRHFAVRRQRQQPKCGIKFWNYHKLS